ncbi:hypothetical protein TRFO_06245 [Tritrichomonas foetus]|uniref:Choline transporter-like protein n=1 Tax=Tritrichomonas foetus TaxID=1144522 RepID=A0A1J4K5P0_9EUKA|nr:hypothetical protein TRFO_06245 [Tritrichomonas foetus]|eukprot:OHT04789.1 hypothetical protein TRFO_06245 [Tritrichomonas foetus]
MRRATPTPVQEERNYMKNSSHSTGFKDTFWGILFIINLIVFSIFLNRAYQQTFGKGFFQKITSNDSENSENSDFSEFSYLRKVLVLGLAVSGVTNLAHLVFAISFPVFYIGVNIYLGLVTSIVVGGASIIYSISEFSIAGFIGAAISIALGVASFLYCRRCQKTSALLLKGSSEMILKHPGVLLVEAGATILLFFLSAVFIISFFLLKEQEANYGILIYAFFSFCWISSTIYFVCYMTISGVTGSEFYHRSQALTVLGSFARASTALFGCAAFAGLFWALIQTLQQLTELLKPEEKKKKKKKSDDDDDKEKGPSLLRIVLYYVLSFILKLAKDVFEYFARHALIYCAVFGISFKDAVKKWANKSIYTQIKKANHYSMVTESLVINYFIFTAIACVVSYFASSNLYPTTYATDELKLTISVMSVVVTFVLMTVFYTVLSSVFTTTTDTLMLCYLETPGEMQKRFTQLYNTLQQNTLT